MRALAALVAVGIVGCGFQPGPVSSNAGADGRLSDGSGSGSDGSATGACAHATCPAACEDTSTGPVCYAPMKCADAQAHGQPANADTTLYMNGSAGSPWTAYCNGSDEYLTVDPATNYGQYAAGGRSAGTTVTTNYMRVRIFVEGLTINVNNQTFAASTGGPLMNASTGMMVDSMPLGIAMDCVNNFSATGQAEIDLTGNPFVVTSAWVIDGNKGSGAAISMNGGATVMITGGGNCAWDMPSGYVPTNQGFPFDPTGIGSNVSVSYAP
jgi:hypothetical protein